MEVVLREYHGLGNDCPVFGPNKNTLRLSQENVKLIYDRHFDVGSDGVLEGPILEKERMEVHIWDPSDSIVERNGNGVRIFIKHLKDAGYVQKTHVTLSILVGDMDVQYLNKEGARMGAPMDKMSFWDDEVPVSGERREVVNKTMMFGKIFYHVTCVTVSNPHYIIFLNEVSKDIVYRIGKNSENVNYFPERINTQIIRVIDRQNIEIEICEYGADYILTSGNNGCAAMAMAYERGLIDSKTYMEIPGGILKIEILDDWTMSMTRNISFVGTMQLDNTLVEQLRTSE